MSSLDGPLIWANEHDNTPSEAIEGNGQTEGFTGILCEFETHESRLANLYVSFTADPAVTYSNRTWLNRIEPNLAGGGRDCFIIPCQGSTYIYKFETRGAKPPTGSMRLTNRTAPPGEWESNPIVQTKIAATTTFGPYPSGEYQLSMNIPGTFTLYAFQIEKHSTVTGTQEISKRIAANSVSALPLGDLEQALAMPPGGGYLKVELNGTGEAAVTIIRTAP
jgi:hypothetical protein